MRARCTRTLCSGITNTVRACCSIQMWKHMYFVMKMLFWVKPSPSPPRPPYTNDDDDSNCTHYFRLHEFDSSLLLVCAERATLARIVRCMYIVHIYVGYNIVKRSSTSEKRKKQKAKRRRRGGMKRATSSSSSCVYFSTCVPSSDMYRESVRDRMGPRLRSYTLLVRASHTLFFASFCLSRALSHSAPWPPLAFWIYFRHQIHATRTNVKIVHNHNENCCFSARFVVFRSRVGAKRQI